MERISIFNYEAFYLDYLEGNLSEEDTQMLLQFFEEHPECRLEDEELTVLDDAAPMSYSGKHSLKQVDESAAIASENVEHFMIAEAEGLLDENKQSELNDFVAEDAGLQATRKRYASVYFEPDESVIFTGKADLKQRKSIVLWPYLSSGVAAAAAVIAFVFFTNLNTDSVQPLNISFEMPVVPEEPIGDETENENPSVETPQNTFNNKKNVQFAGTKPEVRKNQNIKFDKMPVRKDGIHTFVFDEAELAPVNTSNNNPVVADNGIELQPNGPLRGANPKSDDLAQMTNPIAPVTKFISENTETKVDFGKRKGSKSKKGGFFVKIGKFELSKNKH